MRMAKMVPQYYCKDEVPRWKRGFGNHLQTGGEVYLPTLSSEVISPDLGVSKNSGTPKWMVKIMENPIKMDDLGVPLFLETPILGVPLLN